MPQLLLIITAGAGLILVRRWIREHRARLAAELKAAHEAMERRDLESAVPLEQDPSTGVYRPKRTH